MVALAGAIYTGRCGWALGVAGALGSSAGAFLLLARHERWIHRIPVVRRYQEKGLLGLRAFASLVDRPRLPLSVASLSIASFVGAIVLISVLLAFSRAPVP